MMRPKQRRSLAILGKKGTYKGWEKSRSFIFGPPPTPKKRNGRYKRWLQKRKGHPYKSLTEMQTREIANKILEGLRELREYIDSN